MKNMRIVWRVDFRYGEGMRQTSDEGEKGECRVAYRNIQTCERLGPKLREVMKRDRIEQIVLEDMNLIVVPDKVRAQCSKIGDDADDPDDQYAQRGRT